MVVWTRSSPSPEREGRRRPLLQTRWKQVYVRILWLAGDPLLAREAPQLASLGGSASLLLPTSLPVRACFSNLKCKCATLSRVHIIILVAQNLAARGHPGVFAVERQTVSHCDRTHACWRARQSGLSLCATSSTLQSRKFYLLHHHNTDCLNYSPKTFILLSQASDSHSGLSYCRQKRLIVALPPNMCDAWLQDHISSPRQCLAMPHTSLSILTR